MRLYGFQLNNANFVLLNLIAEPLTIHIILHVARKPGQYF